MESFRKGKTKDWTFRGLLLLQNQTNPLSTPVLQVREIRRQVLQLETQTLQAREKPGSKWFALSLARYLVVVVPET